MIELTPTFAEFKRLARKANVIPIYREIIADRVTPVSVYERLRAGEHYTFLLESVEGGEHSGRYSFIGRRPHALFLCQKGRVTYQEEGKKNRIWMSTNPVQDLNNIFQCIRTLDMPGLPRFWGGAVGYWDYDTVRFFERLPKEKPDSMGFPQGAFQLSGEVVILDRFSQTAKVISNAFIQKPNCSIRELRVLYQKAAKAIEAQVHRILDRSFVPPQRFSGASSAPVPLVSKAEYIAAVKKGKEHIRAGDIIQVVLSQRWELKPETTPFQVYRALRLVNPSPYMYFLDFSDFTVVGSSPELLVRKEGTLAETCPIAGTRPRGKTEIEDHALGDELLADAKERAEHLMLVDLGRNDLGRVCEPGSVQVPEFMTIERYSHVMHIVSTVKGTLKRNANAFDLFQACFPAGTVTGSPKIRAMEIINDLEHLRRGPYAGAVGYFSYTGNMDMAITIRTLIFNGKKAYLQAGAGIVADSVPENEYNECHHKAAAIFTAVKRAAQLT